RDAHVRMDVCNMLGQTLLTPVNGMETAGAHTVDVVMDGFPSGVYVVRMSVGGRVLTRQMTLIR
ncbi:MAG: T9SS type A sorting domain-containing protein, partial [Candidatus Kapaibacteriota bacterium]